MELIEEADAEERLHEARAEAARLFLAPEEYDIWDYGLSKDRADSLEEEFTRLGLNYPPSPPSGWITVTFEVSE